MKLKETSSFLLSFSDSAHTMNTERSSVIRKDAMVEREGIGVLIPSNDGLWMTFRLTRHHDHGTNRL